MEKTIKNVATNPNKETIGELVMKHSKKFPASLCRYVYDYLNEENGDLFYTLMKCTTCSLIAKINEDNVVEVNDFKKNLYATFDYDYPVVDVFKDLLFKMSKDVELCMMYLRKQYIEEGGEFRIWSDDVAKFKALREFATDYGLDITQRKKNNIPYIDVIGISPLPITTNSNICPIPHQ